MPINAADLAAGDLLYPVAERCIFRYGLRRVDDWCGDPLAIDQRQNELLSIHDANTVAKWSRDKRVGLQIMALQKIWPSLAATLGLPEFDDTTGEGYTGDELLGVFRRFRKWKHSMTARWRLTAEMIGTYGQFTGTTLTYEGYVGLALNRTRVQSLTGAAVWLGVIAAGARNTAPFDLVDAMAPTLGHAHELAEMIESNRAEAQAWAEKQRAG